LNETDLTKGSKGDPPVLVLSTS